MNIAFEKKCTALFALFALWKGIVQKVQKVQGKKNDMAKLTKLANFRQNFVKIAKIVMQIFIRAAKSEEDIFYLFVQNYPKGFKNFDIFHKRHKGNKGARLQKMYVRPWDFGTLKSHSLKVLVQILYKRHGMPGNGQKKGRH